jgi:hypothetical protein
MKRTVWKLGVGLGVLGTVWGLMGCEKKCSTCQVRAAEDGRSQVRQASTASPPSAYRRAAASVNGTGTTRS